MATSSKEERVQGFLDDLEMLGADKFKLVSALREMVFACDPAVGERMMYGGIMFSLGDDFGGLFVRKHHVSFEFGNGYQLDDPDKHLEGKGKWRRHLKLRSIADIEAKKVYFYVRQAVSREATG